MANAVELLQSSQHAIAFDRPANCDGDTLRAWFMRSCLWSQLPDELLELIFARLPVAQIYPLRVLSKQWRSNLTPRSYFKRLCALARPQLFALMRADPQRGKLRFKLFDARSHLWHNAEYTLAREYRDALTVASNGLLCFVPHGAPLPILICNPLTSEWKQLPFPNRLRNPNPRMIQFRAQSDSYTLTLVGSIAPDTLAAETYSSATSKWTSLHHGVLSGYTDYRFSGSHNPSRGERLGVYDCSKRSLTRLDSYSSLPKLHYSAALTDRLFMLDPSRHEILELQGRLWNESSRRIKIPRQTGRGENVRLVELSYGVHTAVHACEGLVLVTEGGFGVKLPEKEWRVGYGHRCLLYDMGKGAWWTLPGLEKEYDVYAYNARDVSEALMCKLNWWARP